VLSPTATKSLFAFAVGATLLAPAWPSFGLVNAFVPVLVAAAYRLDLGRLLWLALGCGLLLDSLATFNHLGLYASGFCAAAYCIHRLRRWFFEDEWTTLPLLSALFAGLSRLGLFLSFSLLERPVSLGGCEFLDDLSSYAVLHGLYGLACIGAAQALGALKALPKGDGKRPRPQ
jgi:rod shape-determining protein MreD